MSFQSGARGVNVLKVTAYRYHYFNTSAMIFTKGWYNSRNKMIGIIKPTMTSTGLSMRLLRLARV